VGFEDVNYEPKAVIDTEKAQVRYVRFDGISDEPQAIRR